VLDAWDIYFKHQEPTLQVQVSDKPLTCLANTTSGEHLVVGNQCGSCSVLQLSSSMWMSPKEEKAAVNAMLEREGLRWVACLHTCFAHCGLANVKTYQPNCVVPHKGKHHLFLIPSLVGCH
jgi:hypothetical protein